MWVTLSEALDDGRRHLPYAPYLMFVIERVTGRRHTRETPHNTYILEKLAPFAATRAPGERMHGASASTARDVPESSRARSQRKKGISKTVKDFLKGIFTMCQYSADTAYQARLELREHRESSGLPPLPPPPPPPQITMPEFSDDDDDDDGDDFEAEAYWGETLHGYQQRQRRQTRAASSSGTAGTSGSHGADDDDDDEESDDDDE
jgi:hypothetical protein